MNERAQPCRDGKNRAALRGSTGEAEPGSAQRVRSRSGAVPVLANIESDRCGLKKKKNQRRTGAGVPPVCGVRGVTVSGTDCAASQPP